MAGAVVAVSSMDGETEGLWARELTAREGQVG